MVGWHRFGAGRSGDPPRVSVIVPLFNKAPYVRRCLDSIAAQTLTDFEAIIVDDGSTDAGPEIAANYPDARFRVTRQRNRGPGAARNSGIRNSRAQLLAFLDADDAWLPEYLESSVALLNRRGTQVASVTSGYVDYPEGRPSEEIFGPRGITEGIHRIHAGTTPLLLVHMLAYMSPCTTVVRASVLQKWGGFHEDSRFGEDAAMWIRVLLNEAVCFQLRPLVRIHRDASELSQPRNGLRGIEPFLINPAETTCACPTELLPLLHRFFAIRACKTAAVLGYWGRSAQARQIFRRFVSVYDRDLPFFASALIGCTPAAGIFGWTMRRLGCFRLARPDDILRRIGTNSTVRSKSKAAGK